MKAYSKKVFLKIVQSVEKEPFANSSLTFPVKKDIISQNYSFRWNVTSSLGLTNSVCVCLCIPCIEARGGVGLFFGGTEECCALKR